MSAAGVRHHLSILLRDGRVVMAGEYQDKRRGRPVKIYRLSEKFLGDNLSILSSALLKLEKRTRKNSKQQTAMQALAEEITDQIGKVDTDSPVPKRLINLLTKLNEMNYQTRWEAGAEGPRILFGHCPYASIIDRHPELCQMDGFLIGEGLGSRVKQLAKIDQKPGGVRHCIFLVA